MHKCDAYLSAQYYHHWSSNLDKGDIGEPLTASMVSEAKIKVF